MFVQSGAIAGCSIQCSDCAQFYQIEMQCHLSWYLNFIAEIWVYTMPSCVVSEIFGTRPNQSNPIHSIRISFGLLYFKGWNLDFVLRSAIVMPPYINHFAKFWNVFNVMSTDHCTVLNSIAILYSVSGRIEWILKIAWTYPNLVVSCFISFHFISFFVRLLFCGTFHIFI